MKKMLAMLLLVFGITFIYNPETNTGFVYMNDANYNAIIMVDPHSNLLRYYRGTIYFEERLDYGFDVWMKDKVQKGLPFKSLIYPYRQQQQEQRKW